MVFGTIIGTHYYGVGKLIPNLRVENIFRWLARNRSAILLSWVLYSASFCVLSLGEAQTASFIATINSNFFISLIDKLLANSTQSFKIFALVISNIYITVTGESDILQMESDGKNSYVAVKKIDILKIVCYQLLCIYFQVYNFLFKT